MRIDFAADVCPVDSNHLEAALRQCYVNGRTRWRWSTHAVLFWPPARCFLMENLICQRCGCRVGEVCWPGVALSHSEITPAERLLQRMLSAWKHIKSISKYGWWAAVAEYECICHYLVPLICNRYGLVTLTCVVESCYTMTFIIYIYNIIYIYIIKYNVYNISWIWL